MIPAHAVVVKNTKNLMGPEMKAAPTARTRPGASLGSGVSIRAHGIYSHPRITQNDHFVALPATGMCNVGVRLRNGTNLATTSVLDVGPWCPNTPVPRGQNQCTCSSDRYWQGTGVPFAATAPCATTHAGIDLADGTFADLGLTNNGNIYWRFQ
jgi:hypothetical protein